MKAIRKGSKLGQWLAIALIIILLDQFTKVLIVGSFQLGESSMVTSFFNVVRVHNSGAAFSFLAGASGWQRWFFVGLGAVAAVGTVNEKAWKLGSAGGSNSGHTLLRATGLTLPSNTRGGPLMKR